MNPHGSFARVIGLLLVAAFFAAFPARADVVTDWDAKAVDIVVAANLPNPPMIRLLAIVQTAVYEAANAVTRKYPPSALTVQAAPGASLDAAVAAAAHATLVALLPAQQAAIDSAYDDALENLPRNPGRVAGIAAGEQAAAAVLQARAGDGAEAAESYRPATTAGVYVPTVLPLALPWPGRKPWLMASAAQFRPEPPPAMTSPVWARDYAEIKAVGAKASVTRTPEQTAIARFWEATGPGIYHGLLQSLALQPGRDVTRNARLFAAAAQAADDAMIAVFDAKYHYNFWRPITAIRNGDIDGNDATQRDPSWLPLIDTPMHPEYPCAHCILSGAIGTVIRADVGDGPIPTLSTTSATAGGVSRSWTSMDDFMKEVANARVYDGVHYRNSTEVGTAMGKKIGELAAAKLLRSP